MAKTEINLNKAERDTLCSILNHGITDLKMNCLEFHEVDRIIKNNKPLWNKLGLEITEMIDLTVKGK